jgi:hypothetical protein
MSCILEGRYENKLALILSNFLCRRFLPCRPFDRCAAVQGRAVSLSQCQLVEDLHEVLAIRFLGSATSTVARCNLFNYFVYVNLFNYLIYVQLFDYFVYVLFFIYIHYVRLHRLIDYIERSTTSTVCHFYSHPLVR